MPTDSFTSALDRLDPASRALLDLSLRRGMRTEEIADVLGAEPESVEASRDEALRRIASDVGMHDDAVRDRLAEMPADEWMGNGTSTAVIDEPTPEPEPEPVADEPKDEPKRRGRLWPLLLGLLLTAGVIVAIAIGTSDNGDESAVSQPSQSNAQAPAKTESGATKLTAVGASEASGTAEVNDGKLDLNATLPRGTYEIWLYNSILDARSLGKHSGGQVKVTADLPGNWKRFRFVDVSRERNDGNLSHSGESVLRVTTKSLSRR